jgi:hypothetical protein
MRTSRALFVVAVMLAGCSSSGDDANAPPPPQLDGVYQGDANGEWSWGSFHDDRYALWKSGEGCGAPGASADVCGETGTFALDAKSKTLTLTQDGTGAVHTLHIDIAANGSLVHPQGFVGSGAQLNSGSSSVVATQFAVYQPSNDNLVQQVDLRTTTFALLQACALLLGKPVAKPDPVVLPPAPIVRTCGGK